MEKLKYKKPLISIYGKILILVCLLDLLITCVLLNIQDVEEGGPLLKFYYNIGGQTTLAITKIIMNAFSITLLELVYLKTKTNRYYQFTITLYLIVFTVGMTPWANEILYKL
jgi:hypothetical protein